MTLEGSVTKVTLMEPEVTPEVRPEVILTQPADPLPPTGRISQESIQESSNKVPSKEEEEEGIRES